MTANSPATQTAEPAKVAITPLVIAVAFGTLLSVSTISGVMYYLARSGRLHVLGSSTPAALPMVQQPTHALVLEPLLVNLADVGGNAYLRVGVTLRVADTTDKTSAKQGNGSEKSDTDKEAAAGLRDTALTVLGRQTSGDLLAPDGKDRLKSELRRALAEHNAEIKVTDLYFTEFLVQR